MRKKMVCGNWKMNGDRASIAYLLGQLLSFSAIPSSAECVILPPSIYLPLVQQFLINSTFAWGAQNVYPEDSGAFTGELSAPMLQDYLCRYVLVGHSERRQLFGEDEKFIADKFYHVKKHAMIPILCIGETMEEREQGLTMEVLTKQLLPIKETGDRPFANCVVAYEPIWAIGTGKTASPELAQEVHHSIRRWISAECNQEDAQVLTILYGGSVTNENANALFAMPDIDGGLVGGASLNAERFVDIVKCIK